MAKFKNPINEVKLPQLNHSVDKTVSYTQYSTWRNCQHQWYLNYAQGNYVYSPSIHATFGTAIHTTLQDFLTKTFEISKKKALEIDWYSYFKEQLSEEYKKALKSNKDQHFSSPDQLKEFYEDGCAIIDAFIKDFSKWFGVRGWKLIGIEVPILHKLTGKNNLYMKGFIDIVVYEEAYDRYYIYDIKTSTKGWGDKEKKDQTKMQQILLYKKFFSELYNIDIDKIEVEFIVVKRKLWENADFVIPRTQSVKPAAGKTKMKQATLGFEEFLSECFTKDGNYIYDKEYPKNVSKNTCTWCPFNGTLCDKGEKKVEFFS